ncbi:hypothetical protein [Photobacterium kasasachensis]|uniref:hypothetical protein n=1 Tax=Photobacterium kasasachensis TaxID=2910240 RepID=UPI003D0D4CFF
MHSSSVQLYELLSYNAEKAAQAVQAVHWIQINDLKEFISLRASDVQLLGVLSWQSRTQRVKSRRIDVMKTVASSPWHYLFFTAIAG